MLIFSQHSRQKERKVSCPFLCCKKKIMIPNFHWTWSHFPIPLTKQRRDKLIYWNSIITSPIPTKSSHRDRSHLWMMIFTVCMNFQPSFKYISKCFCNAVDIYWFQACFLFNACYFLVTAIWSVSRLPQHFLRWR